MSDTNFKYFQTTQFRIKELSMEVQIGGSKQKIDISGIFEEINLFDNIFMPCMSANIVIRDSQNLFDKIKLNGDEKVIIIIDKGATNTKIFDYKKEFVVYKISDRSNLNSTSQIYTLNLINEDYLYSLQKRIKQHFKCLYSEVVTKVLSDYLKVTNARANSLGSGIGNIYPTKNIQDIVIPFLTPFDTFEFVAKRAISLQGNPDFVFYENMAGYNFEPISEIMIRDSRFTINFKPKNVTHDDNFSEFLGAREMKVLSSFDTIDNIRNGSYTGKFIGFDTITRTQNILKINDTFSQVKNHANKYPNLVSVKFKNDKSTYEAEDSRTVIYPFTITRTQLQYIKENNPPMATILDNTHEYMFQRKAIFTNLMQKRIQVALPGNFGLYSGSMVELIVPKFGTKEPNAGYNDTIDQTLTGKYLIVGARHVIKYNKHETLIEVATDSNIR